MARKYMTIEQIRQEAIENGIEYTLEEGEKVEDLGICALVDVENMGFCKDDVTRWYHFTNNKGEACIYIKHGGEGIMKITFECFYQGEGRRKSRFYEAEADENDIKDNFVTLDNKVWEHFITFDMPIKDSVDDWNMRIVKKEEA